MHDSAVRPVLAVRLSRPFRRFADWKASGGLVLIVAAAVSMLLANSEMHGAVEALWNRPLTIALGDGAFSLTLREWISDGLMAVFFLLVGLEIKSELLVGELSSARTASLPLAAALGGMLVPAVIYSALNWQSPAISGWAVPTATDIAFALGVLALLGSRVPPGLTVFLAALAIADDLGAVVIISLFYGHAPDVTYLMASAVVVGALLAANAAGVAWKSVYLLLGVVLWYCVLRSGVHATVAGVLLAATIPARSRINPAQFELDAAARLEQFAIATGEDDRPVLSNGGQQAALAALETSVEHAQPVLAHLKRALHAPVNFWIMPLFALANAGVRLDGSTGSDALVTPVSLGVACGLVFGKPIGVILGTWVATRFGATLPGGIGWRTIAGVGCLAGIGFTMSLFVTGLAFTEPSYGAQAKVGIVSASLIASVIGLFVVWLTTRPVGAALPDAVSVVPS
jgi:Na+:H+ antiporter, NhaA family